MLASCFPSVSERRRGSAVPCTSHGTVSRFQRLSLECSAVRRACWLSYFYGALSCCACDQSMSWHTAYYARYTILPMSSHCAFLQTNSLPLVLPMSSLVSASGMLVPLVYKPRRSRLLGSGRQLSAQLTVGRRPPWGGGGGGAWKGQGGGGGSGGEGGFCLGGGGGVGGLVGWGGSRWGDLGGGAPGRFGGYMPPRPGSLDLPLPSL